MVARSRVLPGTLHAGCRCGCDNLHTHTHTHTHTRKGGTGPLGQLRSKSNQYSGAVNQPRATQATKSTHVGRCSQASRLWICSCTCESVRNEPSSSRNVDTGRGLDSCQPPITPRQAGSVQCNGRSLSHSPHTNSNAPPAVALAKRPVRCFANTHQPSPHP